MKVESPMIAVREHISRKCKLYFDDPDTVSGHIENERSITNNYRGRVLYELLQNAIDRAERGIWISFDSVSRSVIVANDGHPFSEEKREKEPRSDLAALCSLHTSNKAIGESIGNKGVGFKSVWEFCRSVQVRTKGKGLNQDWGIRLRWPFTEAALDTWCDQALVADIKNALYSSEIEEKHQGKAPSFYFPEYITTPIWRERGVVTAIELEDVSEEAYARLIDGSLQDLLCNQLHFASDIRRDKANLTLNIRIDDEFVEKQLHTDDRWIRIEIDTSSESSEFESLAEELGFEIARAPRLTLGLPLDIGGEMSAGKFHSYLPTEVGTNSPLHVQGDFYLSESRKQIDFSHNRYNIKLLELAVDHLLLALEKNINGISELPYVLSLLNAGGVIGRVLRGKLTGKGELLAKIFSCIVNVRRDHPLRFYDDIFKIIGNFTPSKVQHYHNDHVNITLKNYFKSFASDDLKVVPIEFNSKHSEDEDPIVSKSCSLTIPDRSSKESKLFCRRNTEQSLGLRSVNLPGVVVTSWSFPGQNGLSGNLKKLSVWSDYDAVSVLRSLVRAQNDSSTAEERSELLVAAKQIYGPKEQVNRTHWRFISEEVHPSQRILLPVQGSDSWKEVRYCYLDDRFPELGQYLDGHTFHRIDVARCKALLGDRYKSVLKFWGVWDVIPLVPAQKSYKHLRLPLSSYPEGAVALRLYSESETVWDQLPYPAAVQSILKKLESREWLSVAAGSTNLVAPNTAYFSVPNGSVDGFYLFNPEGLDDLTWHFLNKVGVSSVESTTDIGKLVGTIEGIVENCKHTRQIRGSVLSAYRLLIRRINRLLKDIDADKVDLELLNRIPLIYETSDSNRRAIAAASDTVWYVSGGHKGTRSRISNEDVVYWVASGDVATLAGYLEKVTTLTSEARIKDSETRVATPSFREQLEEEYLPDFIAIACYGDIPGMAEVDEQVVQRRWQSLEIYQSDEVKLLEAIGSSGNIIEETTTCINETGMLWESLRSDSKRKLTLYISSRFSLSTDQQKSRICQWFSQEVFRRRELAHYFEAYLLERKDLDALGVSQNALMDSKDIVQGWLPEDLLAQLLVDLSKLIGIEITKQNWRDYSIYKHRGLNFSQLMNALSPQLQASFKVMNPSDRNGDMLLAFVDAHARNIAGLPGFAEFDHDEWLQLLDRHESRFNFGFCPESFVCGSADVTTEDFYALEGSLALELKQLSDTPNSPTPPVEALGLPRQSNVIRTGNPSPGGASPSLVSSISDEEHASQQLSNAKAGKKAEEFLVIGAAQRMEKLPHEHQVSLLKLIKREYERLSNQASKSLGFLVNTALLDKHSRLSQREWKELIHVASRVDGAGYDYIDCDVSGRAIMLVEAKSSQLDAPLIYLSEAERKRIVEYASECFISQNSSVSWRLYLITKDDYVDATDIVKEIVTSHQQAYSRITSHMLPDGWVIKGLSFE